METQTNHSPKETVLKLREEAAASPAFKAVCQMFAKRKRARAQVTLANLTNVMLLSGYEYSTKDYADVLRKLSGIGIGKLDYNRAGKLRSLKDIKVTLQSVGMAAIDKMEALSTFKARQSYSEILPESKQAIIRRPAVKPAPPVQPTQTDDNVEITGITVKINGQECTVTIPLAMRMLLGKLYSQDF